MQSLLTKFSNTCEVFGILDLVGKVPSSLGKKHNSPNGGFGSLVALHFVLLV